MSELKHEVEKVFASVAKLEPEEHKNVLGDKWKFINAVVTFIQNRESPINEVCPDDNCTDCAGSKLCHYPDWCECPKCKGTGKRLPDREKIKTMMLTAFNFSTNSTFWSNVAGEVPGQLISLMEMK